MLEIKFSSTNCKRVKFVFKNIGTATASEMMFYHQDPASDIMETLFADDSYLVVNEAYNSIDALDTLEENVKDHPLYENFKVLIYDARAIVLNNKYTAGQAATRVVNYLENEEYNDRFEVQRDQIVNIVSKGVSTEDGPAVTLKSPFSIIRS